MDLKCLHDIGDDEHRDHYSSQQRLQGGQPIRGVLGRFRGCRHGTGRSVGTGLSTILVSGAAAAGVARCSRTWRAASCSAFFLVDPSARPVNSAFPCPAVEYSLASTVKVLLCSGPASFTNTYDACGRPLACKDSCSADLKSITGTPVLPGFILSNSGITTVCRMNRRAGSRPPSR